MAKSRYDRNVDRGAAQQRNYGQGTKRKDNKPETTAEESMITGLAIAIPDSRPHRRRSRWMRYSANAVVTSPAGLPVVGSISKRNVDAGRSVQDQQDSSDRVRAPVCGSTTPHVLHYPHVWPLNTCTIHEIPPTISCEILSSVHKTPIKQVFIIRT